MVKMNVVAERVNPPRDSTGTFAGQTLPQFTLFSAGATTVLLLCEVCCCPQGWGHPKVMLLLFGCVFEVSVKQRVLMMFVKRKKKKCKKLYF